MMLDSPFLGVEGVVCTFFDRTEEAEPGTSLLRLFFWGVAGNGRSSYVFCKMLAGMGGREVLGLGLAPMES